MDFSKRYGPSGSTGRRHGNSPVAKSPSAEGRRNTEEFDLTAHDNSSHDNVAHVDVANVAVPDDGPLTELFTNVRESKFENPTHGTSASGAHASNKLIN